MPNKYKNLKCPKCDRPLEKGGRCSHCNYASISALTVLDYHLDEIRIKIAVIHDLLDRITKIKRIRKKIKR